MPAKIFEIEGIGRVAVYRRKDTRRLTIRITEDGVRVSAPAWAPYRSALNFVVGKKDWILSHQRPKHVYRPGSRIGKYHRLVFIPSASTKATVRVTDIAVTVKIPTASDPLEQSNQLVAKKGIIKALVAEGRQLLPQRLASLAQKHNFQYQGPQVRQLKSRWGSCSSQGFITLNCFLMQLPWPNIDYVLIHELAHTQVHAHDAAFWQLVEQNLPDFKERRKEMRQFQPMIAVE